MRKILLFVALTVLICSNLEAQEDIEYKKDLRPQAKREDSQNQFQSEDINNLDLIQALSLMGISIHKFRLGEFDKKYTLAILIDEYQDGKLIDSRTLINNNNIYYHWPEPADENSQPFFDYIDQISFYAKETDGEVAISISTYSFSLKNNIKQNKTRDGQFYNWRRYSKTEWKLNEPIPMLVYASSWYDKEFDFDRFCGTVDLSRSIADTKELLESSPHYFIVSYKVSE